MYHVFWNVAQRKTEQIFPTLKIQAQRTALTETSRQKRKGSGIVSVPCRLVGKNWHFVTFQKGRLKSGILRLKPLSQNSQIVRDLRVKCVFHLQVNIS